MSDSTCVVCTYRTPVHGYVCDPCRTRIRQQLDVLPGRLIELVMHLVPGGTMLGERVATSRGGSPSGARMGALNLLGPGSDGLSEAQVSALLHPRIRKWSTTHTVDVVVTVGGSDAVEQRRVTTWHQELVRDAAGRVVRVLPDDQIGLIPPAEWLGSWAAEWRRELCHHARPRHRGRGQPKDAETATRALMDETVRQKIARLMLGLGDYVPPAQRPDDPLADEWEVRFGQPTRAHAPAADAAYLLTWLDTACDRDLRVVDFATELRAVSAEIGRVLGEQPDQQWLGRCPTLVADRPGGGFRRCGAGLWQDPYASQIKCTRCRSVWRPENIEVLMLARLIRQVWPVDRRRRYHRAEIDDIARTGGPRCPACDATASVTWKEVTARQDRERTWQPTHAACPNECPDAGRLL